MAPVELNKTQFASRVKKVYEGWNVRSLFLAVAMRLLACLNMGAHSVQSASQNDDYSSIADVDALLLLAGDPGAEDEPVRKGTSFQVRALHCLTAPSLTILITYYF